MVVRTLALISMRLMVAGHPVFAGEKNWSDAAELSFVDTGGNTDTTSLSAKNKLTYRFHSKTVMTWSAAALYGETDGEKTAERYSSEVRVDYLFTERAYAAVTAGWEQDRFTDIDARYFAGPTLGYRLLTGPAHFLRVEAGVNYVLEKYDSGSDENFSEGCASGEYTYQFSDKTAFRQQVRGCTDLQDSRDYQIRSETSLTTSLTDRFSLKTSYEVKFDNAPAADDIEKTDTFLSVALVADF